MRVASQFRFTFENNWISPASYTVHGDREVMSAFYEYAEPFSCECRAFGRLAEAGREDLAVRCFGYVLLDEAHERALHARFPDVEFDGDVEYNGGDEIRTRFLGRDGRAPPIRGIVKQFGNAYKEEEEEEAEEPMLRPPVLRRMLRDVGALQRLGIVRIDVAVRQLVDGRISDFSTAVTTPHFVTTPELNPRLTPAMRAAMELETFQLALGDYLAFDDMVLSWNYDHVLEGQRGWRPLDVSAFPGGRGCGTKHGLRSQAARERLFTFVDPRRYDWKTGKWRQPRGPSGWEYHCSNRHLVEWLTTGNLPDLSLDWDYKDGFITPRA